MKFLVRYPALMDKTIEVSSSVTDPPKVAAQEFCRIYPPSGLVQPPWHVIVRPGDLAAEALGDWGPGIAIFLVHPVQVFHAERVPPQGTAADRD